MEFLDNCPPICSQRVQDLIIDIRDASYEAEDILESLIATHFLRIDGSDSYRRLKRFPEYSFEQIKELLELIEPSFGLLKVLQVSTKSMKFPVEILELVNLKYLELGQVSEIPSSISRLRNLQTIIPMRQDDQSLPTEIWEMPQLRHLVVCFFSMPDIPDVQGKGTNAYVLKNLQTLVGIFDFRYTQDVLTRIPHLKWLYVFCTMPFHSSNSLVYLHKLESLHCFFEDMPTENILPTFFFPSSLKKLVLSGSQIPWEQLTIIGILPNLKVLKLNNKAMVGDLWETNYGEFKQLNYLKISDSDPVKWKTEKDHFPCLKYLKLQFCHALEAIPSEIGEIPTLTTIELIRCSLGIESSAKEMLGEDSDIELMIDNDEKV